MKKRMLLMTLAATVLVWGFGALEARAGQVALPTTLDQLLPAGSFAVVGPEPDTFSNFTFSASAIPPSTPVLAAGGIDVKEFHAGTENGLEFSGPLFAPAGTIVDYAISYVVTAPKGFVINDAVLAATYNIPSGSTGSVVIGETLLNPANGSGIGSLSLTSPDFSTSINFAGVTSILVKKDILLVGGSLGAGVSFIDQGFSSAVPEPASMSLMGIGMAGFFAYRRLFKRRTTVA
jgi:hypothetical protein